MATLFAQQSNISKIAHSVTSLGLSQNNLQHIGEWQDLKGKSLRYLNVQKNPALTLNLGDLDGNHEYLPLRQLSVSKGQITQCFGLCGVMGTDPSYNRLREWFMHSSLGSLTVACKSSGHDKHTNY